MGKTILVADDSDTICRAVEMTFQATEFSVVSARSGDDALGQIERVQPDLVLADCIMDGVDGYTVCARIKDAGHAIPVVLMASSAQPVDRQRAEMARANTSLSKPFDTKTLLNVVRQLTGTEPVAETPLTFADALARRNRPQGEIEPPLDVTDFSPEVSSTYAVSSADIIIEDEPAVMDTFEPPNAEIEAQDAQMMAAGPTLEPPAPPEEMAEPGPPVDVWALTEDGDVAPNTAYSAAPNGIDDHVGIDDGNGTPAAMPISSYPSSSAALPAEPAPAPQSASVMAQPESAAAVPPLPASAAIASLSEDELRTIAKEAIEKVVWEVVPELAETIIREELRRLTESEE